MSKAPYLEFFKNVSEIYSYVEQQHDKGAIIKLLTAYQTSSGRLRVNYECKPPFDDLSRAYTYQEGSILVSKSDISTWRTTERNAKLNTILHDS